MTQATQPRLVRTRSLLCKADPVHHSLVSREYRRRSWVLAPGTSLTCFRFGGRWEWVLQTWIPEIAYPCSEFLDRDRVRGLLTKLGLL